jgi:tetratricopeptide (TPR) repeat protein
MVPVLQAAIEAGNGFASYWLGNYYYHSLRPEEAKVAWDMANIKHPGNPQVVRNLAVYEQYQKKDPEKSCELFRKALESNPMDVFMRLEVIAAEKAIGTNPENILKIYLDAPKEQRDSYLYLNGLLQTFENANKWKEAAEYMLTVDRQWSDDVKSWYNFCIDYADYLIDQSKPSEALEWISRSTPTPPNLSNISLPADYFYRQREFFITGLAYKIQGEKAKSQEFFRKVTDEPTSFLFNAGVENSLQEKRFYVALAMKELGMETAAQGILVGINDYRLKHGLITLHLEKSELRRWTFLDPLAEPVSAAGH